MNQTEALNVADEMSDHDAGPIYLDHQATTPLAPSVLDAMLPFFETHYGNPHSLQHPYGVDAATAIEDAREHIAQLLGVRAAEIYFTSGATESNNIVLQGIAAQADQHHIVKLRDGTSERPQCAEHTGRTRCTESALSMCRATGESTSSNWNGPSRNAPLWYR